MTVLAASDGSTPSGGIAGWAVDLMEALGGPGAGLAIALENLFPPLPSELILPLAGFAASQGTLSLLSAVVWTTLGSVVGAVVLYLLGAALGRRRMRALVARIPLLDVSDVDRSEAWFERHGRKAVFFGRMVPVFRSVISIPAGIERMPLPQFVLYTGLGSLLWNSGFILAGYKLGENWAAVDQYSELFQNVVIGITAFLVGRFVTERVIRARRAQETPNRPQ